MHDHSPDRPILGPRQVEILVHTALGHTYKDTANALGISVNTVRNSLRIIIEKLGAFGRAHAVMLALLRGLLDRETLKDLAIPKELESSRNYGTVFEQVMTYVAQGYRNKEIGLALDWSEQTVKNFLMSISKELGARNRAHLVTLALSMGLLDFTNLGH
jgi:DNA-binding CsgD family transcriptional regulator